MCGLFGLLRSPGAAHPGYASQAFVLLGVLAEERGVDAAGAAFLPSRSSALPAGPGMARFRDVTVGGCRVVKGHGRFSGLWRSGLDPALDAAVLAIGHTRWATQGGRRLVNASPLLAGPLVGTHNGDVDVRSLRRGRQLPRASGDTDSEVIFLALAGAVGLAGRVAVLERLTGRAALAWADRSRAGRVHLARGALSPLAVGVDQEGNVFWASNPNWLRVAERETPVRFARKVLLAEGTYLVIKRGTPSRAVARRQFTPVARPDDRYCQSLFRGFTLGDRAAVARLERHTVAWR